MSKHTPGPWEVSHGGHGSPRGFVIDEYFVLNRTVADDVAIAADIVDPATQMPSEANARLIAAAPDLLEVLERIVASSSLTDTQLWAEARDAVAKATAP